MQAIPAQMILPDGTIGIDGATIIPIDINGRLLQRGQTVSVVELGKRLLKAARDGDTEEVRDLMGKGAPFTTDWLGTSPLHLAALGNHVETCEVLLRAGISREARTKVERTPLHMAACHGHTHIAQALLSHGATPDTHDMLRMTPLHWAVQNGHTDIVTLLLRYGADPNSVNKFDKTPMDLAMETNRLDILQLLQVITCDQDKDPLALATAENLTIELTPQDMDMDTVTDHQTDSIEDNEEDMEQSDTSRLTEHLETHSTQNTTRDDGSSSHAELDSLQILKDHGISFLPADNSSVVASAVENGHSLVLTEVGKQVLNSTKPLAKTPKLQSPNHQPVHIQKLPASISKIKGRKVIAVTTEQLLAMANSPKNIFRRLPIGTDKPPVKRIVMNKNQIILSSNTPKRTITVVGNGGGSVGGGGSVSGGGTAYNSEIEAMTRQLAEARRQADEYRQMLRRKEAEAERYKRQLLHMTK